MAANGYGKVLIEEFAERTTLRPGTDRYNSAEFRNVIYALSQWAYVFSVGERAPRLLALYGFYFSAGSGPHSDGKVLIEEFAERTTLRPGTDRYNSAEFCNIIYALSQWAYVFNAGKRAPALFALYYFYSSAGVGPHPDPEFWLKQSRGLSPEERDKMERRFRTWRSDLQNRVALVKKALAQDPSLSERRRKSILGANPLIADLVAVDIPKQLRLRRGKLR